MSRGGAREGAGGKKPPTPDEHRMKRYTIRFHGDILTAIKEEAARCNEKPSYFILRAILHRLKERAHIFQYDRFCKNCGQKWDSEDDTLSIANRTLDCPNCGSKKCGWIIPPHWDQA